MSNEIAIVRTSIEKMQGEFAKTLPAHISPEKFVRTTMSAIQNNPDVLSANRNSLFSACMKAAQDGLILDGREAALVTFNSKAGKMVQYMPMVAGILKKARNSGEISTITAEVVYQNDEFQYFVKDGRPVMFHRPLVFGNRGNPLGVYATAVLKDGGVMTEVLSESDVNSIRAVSRSKDSGPWAGPFKTEMWRKSAIRRLSKRLPSSSDIEETLHADDELFQPEEPIDITPPQHEQASQEAAPAKPARKRTKAAEAVAAASAGQAAPSPAPEPQNPPHDADGVIDAEYTEAVPDDLSEAHTAAMF